MPSPLRRTVRSSRVSSGAATAGAATRLPNPAARPSDPTKPRRVTGVMLASIYATSACHYPTRVWSEQPSKRLAVSWPHGVLRGLLWRVGSATQGRQRFGYGHETVAIDGSHRFAPPRRDGIGI